MKYRMEIAVAALIIVFAAVFLFRTLRSRLPARRPGAGQTARPPPSSRLQATSPGRSPSGCPRAVR